MSFSLNQNLGGCELALLVAPVDHVPRGDGECLITRTARAAAQSEATSGGAARSRRVRCLINGSTPHPVGHVHDRAGRPGGQLLEVERRHSVEESRAGAQRHRHDVQA